VGVLLRTDRGAQYGFLDEVEQSTDNLKPLPYDKVGDKARWLPGQLRFTYIGRMDAGGESTRQVVLVDARDDTSQVVSDPAVRRNYTTATPFRAPEYRDEVLIAATAEHEIAIYRDLGGEHWEEIKVLTSPDPELRYLDGVEVIEGDGADSPYVGCMPWQTAYITAWAKDDLVFPTETGVFLWSLDGTYAQRIDTGNEKGAGHYDPEIVVTRDASSGQESLFVHFTSRDPGNPLRQVNVGQTGLRWPSCAP
jgi:hypothetical protein